MRHHRRRRGRFVWVLLLLAVVGVAGYFYFTHRETRRLTVGAKATVEGSVLGEILLQHLQHRLGQANVLTHPPLTTTRAAHEALIVDEISLYAEYTGTALTTILALPVVNDIDAVREQVRENYRSRFQLEWLGPLGFESSTSLVIRKADADKWHAGTLSELAESKDCCVFGLSKDFEQNANGTSLVMRNYNLQLRGPLQPLEEHQLYTALTNSQVNAISAHSNDGQLTTGNVVFLKDDKHVFPPMEAGLVVRSSTLEAWPQLSPALRELSGRIDAAAMQRMNAAVAIGKRRPADVAAEFLSAHGL